ncbi:amino acid adenylation domain-containing protein [Spirosoma lacussanchae]|uniref:polyketide synthase n=1 Tax=Spirosoma lacussanchae TaxID=1884249 RepID=UPI0011082A4D|nr:polyketide synthase [Spirosoma lacussanchae]
MTPTGLPVTSFPLVHQLVERVAADHPDRVAVVHNNTRLTYRQLNDRADALAQVILQQDPTADYVAISTRRCLEMVIGVLAIVKAGKAYLPLDPEHPEQRLRRIITDSGLKTGVSIGVDASVFETLGLTVVRADLDHEVAPQAVTHRNEVVCVLYTSGSTGQPKGVCQLHTGLIRLMDWQRRHGIVGMGVNTLQFCHLTFDVSSQELFLPLSTGGTVHLIDNADRLDAGRLLAFVRDHHINRSYLPYVAIQYLCEAAIAENRFPDELREITMGGEQLKLTPAMRTFFEALPDCTMMNVYGPAEASIWVTEYRMKGNASAWPTIPPMGWPIVDAGLFIVDEDLTLLPNGEAGEILIAGNCLAAGYLNQPDLTADRFIQWQHPQQGEYRVYRTGDMARYRPDGTLEFAGRRDDMVKIRGNRVELGEIEAALRQIPLLAESSVMVRDGGNGQKQIVAYLVSVTGQPDDALIRRELEQRVTDYMMPSAFVWMDRLPRTISDKVDKKLLPAPELKRPESAGAYRAPKTPLERTICSLWTRLLAIDQVGVDDNFFTLGGNSLLAQQTVAGLKQQQLTLPITKLYQFPTPAGIARYLSQATGPDSPAHFPEALAQPEASAEIAIIGMAGRFPGASTIEAFWNLLTEGRETTRFFTEDELDGAVPNSFRTDSLYVKARGVIEGAELFDAGFFGLAPNQARLMDPQQRVFLEIAWEALEQTGYLPQQYGGRVGVFAGTGKNTYFLNNVLPNHELVAAAGPFQVELLNEKDYIATRTAYTLDLKGPAVSVFSACSTSLLAVAQAVQSLRSGQCEVALAGGASITAPINSGHLYQEGSMLSSDGHTRPFNAGSTGTVFSDGAGVVLLKRAEAARRDGDTIWAIIEGVGVNNDGAGKGSFSAPNAEGQAAAIRAAYADGGVDPATISYVEAHGTATPIGDPIEIEGLTMAFGEQTSRQFCAIGSVKSNFGHLTAAAGVAGLIKTALSLHHQKLPASLGFERPNPAIDFANSPFFVNTQLADWSGESVRRAGVSSFGIGGTNVHVVLKEADQPQPAPSTAPVRPAQLISWSARSADSRDAYAQKLADALATAGAPALADIAYTLHTTRPALAHRRFVVADTTADLLDSLTNPAVQTAPPVRQVPDDIVFMFPGQGAQYLNMGRPLYENEPVFRQAVDECADLLTGQLDRDIRTVMYPDVADADAEARLNDTRYTQPALFITEYALARLWMHWGIQPSVLCGHSIGEFVAAHLAGVFSLADVLQVVSSRGRLVSEQPRGSMLSVRKNADLIRAMLPETLSIAAINSKNLCVVAGPDDAVSEFARQLSDQEIPNKRLPTSHAFHSAMMDPVADALESQVARVPLNRPRKPIISTLTGTLLTDARATDPHYWARHMRETVQFAGALDTMLAFDNPLLFDLGPGKISATLARQQAAGKPVPVLTGLETTTDWAVTCRSMLTTLGQFWQLGLTPDWTAFYAGQPQHRVLLPTYAFSKQRCWVDPPAPVTYPQSAPSPAEPLPTHTTSTEPTHLPVPPMRNVVLLNRINELLEDASGIDLAGVQPSMSFVEIGLDSLLLTQVATTLRREFNVPITFRQLSTDYQSPQELAAYLDKALPADQFQPAPVQATPAPAPAPAPIVAPAPAPVYATPPVSVGSDTALGLIAQQLQLLAKQVALLQAGTPAPPVPAAAPAPQPAPVLNGHMNGTNGAAHAAPNGKAISIPNGQAVDISPEEAAELKKPFGATARIDRQTANLTNRQHTFLKQLTARYTQKTAESKAYTEQHRDQMADPRVVSGFRPLTKEIVYPIVVNRSRGTRLWDVDGNEYIDVLNGFGSNFFGYQPDYIREALHRQIDNGFEVGPQHELAGTVSQLICEMTGADRAALCSTGSEAVLGAMRMARTITGRSLIVAFTGSYHGIMDEVLVRGTKKLKSFPAAAGIMPEAVQNMLILEYGTDESLRIIRERASELAAVLVEPVQSRRPEFLPVDFLKEVRAITASAGTALIFDEVITGFRMHVGGMQAVLDIRADIATYGKVVGAGLPIGVIAGKKAFMDALDGGTWQYGDNSVPEVGVTYFAGTFVRHPLALAAAHASLTHIRENSPRLQEGLTHKTTWLADQMNAICQTRQLPFFVAHYGSLWKIKFRDEAPYTELLFTLMREKGIHIWDGFPCFMTEAHTDADLDAVLAAFSESVNALIEAGFMRGSLPAPAAPQGQLLTANQPPIPGARLGRDRQGNPAWFVANPDLPGKYMQVNN